MPTPPTDQDLAFLRRAIRLAMNGRGHVEPNPMVGCVLVKNGQVVGEGWHGKFGGPHAEPAALADCRARGNDPAGATAYVTLEPCCHTNKKTPPCAPRLIEAKVACVVIGCLDPNPDVNGKGVAMLRAAGVAVDGPVLEGETKQLIAPFLKSLGSRRPYVTLKWAETADGKVAGPGGRRMQISSQVASRLVHTLRARSDAIAVGIGTAMTDDPLLTARGGDTGGATARRYVLDTRLRIPMDGRLVATAKTTPLTVVCSVAAFHEQATRVAELQSAGAEVLEADDDEYGHVSLREFFQSLMGESLTHLLVEPGPTLARAMFPWADRAWVIRSPRRVDDPTAPAAADLPPHYAAVGELDAAGDVVSEYLNCLGEAYFAPVPSADLALAANVAAR
jgi:diaminohydroxyphosphoribosylaminopyrimidine deaminase/5-amino-6-(5-phosphoribosylamino)uracil reductase